MEEKRPDAPFDIGKVFESTLFGLFLLIGRYFNTVFCFVIKPVQFVRHLEENHSTLIQDRTFTRPLTFLTISLVLVTGINFLAFLATPFPEHMVVAAKKIDQWNPFMKFLLEGFKTADPVKLFLAISPYALLIGLYAHMLTRAAKSRKLEFSFGKSIGLSAYFAGSACSVWIILAPFTPLLLQVNLSEGTPKWVYLIGAVLYLLLFRILYCYFYILKMELNVSWMQSIKVWLGGTWRFVVGFFAIIVFIWPLVFPTLDKVSLEIFNSKESQSAAQVNNSHHECKGNPKTKLFFSHSIMNEVIHNYLVEGEDELGVKELNFDDFFAILSEGGQAKLKSLMYEFDLTAEELKCLTLIITNTKEGIDIVLVDKL